MAPQSSAAPPSLPPSVEEAYRRKCVQLKNRTQEVEDANDAARLRLARIKRQVEKLRIERAFLLEQLAKRTSTNVEDSEGSPSPPPTPIDIRNGLDANPRKPKDKPLRIKRGHRKSNVNDAEGKAGANSNKDPGSPASESQSQQPESQSKREKESSANGVSKLPKAAGSAFDLYCEDARPTLQEKDKDGDVNMDEELERGWGDLPDAEKDEYREKYLAQSKKQQDQGSKELEESTDKKERKSSGPSAKTEAQDEDVEMAQYDTEDQETQMDKEGEE
ncbi:hypothetical protein HIM_01678 [Hirsutella minnesotensis 3608]|nr:hypothetical protein HIM_01678 [Hirsutella minnesotensis 3608]